MTNGSSWLQTIVLAIPIVGIPAWSMFGPESLTDAIPRLDAAEDGDFELGDLPASFGDAPEFGETSTGGDDRPAASKMDTFEFDVPERLDASVGAMSGASATPPAASIDDRFALTQGRHENDAADAFAGLEATGTPGAGETSVARDRSWERVVAELKRHDVENLRVSAGSRADRVYVSCSLPDRPLGGKYGVVARRFEAEANDRVAAAEAVLRQIVRWRSR